MFISLLKMATFFSPPLSPANNLLNEPAINKRIHSSGPKVTRSWQIQLQIVRLSVRMRKQS